LAQVKFVPHPYQEQAIDSALSTPRSNLWAGMGMGKTTAAMTVASTLQLQGEITSPILVLGPRRVIQDTWPGEAQKWDHLSGLEVSVALGTPKARATALGLDTAIHAINYDNLPWLVEHWGDRWPYQMVIADEATRLKGMRLGGSHASRAKALGRVAHRRVRRWLNLTGTPSPNGLVDLWGQQWFVDAGERLGHTYTAFEDRWFMRPVRGGEFTKVQPLPFAQDQIEDRLRDCTLSLRPEDHFNLEEPIRRVIEVTLPPKARQLYTEMEKTMFANIGGVDVEVFGAAAKTNKCLQLANGAAYTDDEGSWHEVHTAKIEALESLVQELAGAPLLVAYHFKSDLARLRRAFPKAKTLDDRNAIADWNAGRISVLLAHPASAGHGLNLQQGGHHIAFFGQWWDLEQHDQIVERIGPVRQLQSGFKRPVFIYYIVAKDTVDELVMARRETKRAVQDLLLEAMVRRGA
jgi:SNF2 family DNA or RNA helicase